MRQAKKRDLSSYHHKNVKLSPSTLAPQEPEVAFTSNTDSWKITQMTGEQSTRCGLQSFLASRTALIMKDDQDLLMSPFNFEVHIQPLNSVS